jgi:hypothetical protein
MSAALRAMLTTSTVLSFIDQSHQTISKCEQLWLMAHALIMSVRARQQLQLSGLLDNGKSGKYGDCSTCRS